MDNQPRNWNRWGAEDQRGTLNYVTAEKRLQASRLIRNGRAYSLAIPLRADAPIWPTRHKNWHIATHRNTAGAGPGGAGDGLMMHTHGTTPPLTVHQEFIRDQGGYLLELLYLDDLARDQVYEFMLLVAPL